MIFGKETKHYCPRSGADPLNPYWVLGFGLCVLDLGSWVLGFWFRVFGFQTLANLVFEYWFWVLGLGIWGYLVLGLGVLVIGLLGYWVIGLLGYWVLGFVVLCFGSWVFGFQFLKW